MNEFKIHTTESAPPPAGELLGKVGDSLGFIPNVFAVIAGSAPALQAFVDLNHQFSQSSLTPTERELVQIATSVENQCQYCVAGHTAFANMQDVSNDVVTAARNGGPIPDARLDALHRFTVALVNSKGYVDPKALEGFFQAGYDQRQLLEVILGVCVKFFSNLTNNVAAITLDGEFSDYTWKPDSLTTNNAT